MTIRNIRRLSSLFLRTDQSGVEASMHPNNRQCQNLTTVHVPLDGLGAIKSNLPKVDCAWISKYTYVRTSQIVKRNNGKLKAWTVAVQNRHVTGACLMPGTEYAHLHACTPACMYVSMHTGTVCWWLCLLGILMAILEPLLSLMFRVKVLRMERREAIGGKGRAGGGRGRGGEGSGRGGAAVKIEIVSLLLPTTAESLSMSNREREANALVVTDV